MQSLCHSLGTSGYTSLGSGQGWGWVEAGCGWFAGYLQCACPSTASFFVWVSRVSAPLPDVPPAELHWKIPAGVKLPEFQQDFSFCSLAEERMAVLELPNSAAARRQPRRPCSDATAYGKAASHRLPAAPATQRWPAAESAHAGTRAR